MANAQGSQFGVHSEVGQLRKVMVCAPGRAHQRLTPSNCDELLYDDVIWVDVAKRDHFDFMQKLRDRGVEVAEMHNLLAETVAVPEAKKFCNKMRATSVLEDEASATLAEAEIPREARRPSVAPPAPGASNAGRNHQHQCQRALCAQCLEQHRQHR